MISKIVICCMVSLLCLAACAPVRWVHPTRTDQDFRADSYDCEKVAEQVACNWRQCGNVFTISHEQIMCMQRKYGWKAVRQ